MKIVGLLKTTLLDYPGHVAATIFLGGCNFRCPFCHNMDIVDTGMDSNTELVKNTYELYLEEEIFKFLNKRSGILDGVCITGGEPTLYKELTDFIVKIKELGLLVKLDTNGTNSGMLKDLINKGLLDYVAMDIKSCIKDYGKVSGIAQNPKELEMIENVKKSIEILISANIDYEFRTTIVEDYHNNDTIKEIGELIKGAKKYYLQAYTDSEYVPDHSLSAPTKEKMEEYRETLSEYVENVEIRGME